MKYAIFEFVEDKFCEVGETGWISGEDSVKWPCDIMLVYENELSSLLLAWKMFKSKHMLPKLLSFLVDCSFRISQQF